MTFRRLHFVGALPRQLSREQRQSRVSRGLIVTVVLAAVAWSFSSFTVTPSLLDYGSQSVGPGSSLKPVELVNRSLRDVHPRIRVEGESFSDFVYQGAACATISAGDTCRLPVQFVPGEPGEKKARLVVSLGEDEPYTVALTGTALPPAIVVSPSVVELSNVTVGDSAMAEIKVASKGWFHLQGISLEGTDHAQYGAEMSTCNHQASTPMQCSIVVTFTPQAEGRSTATLVIRDDGLQSPHKVLLSGNGIAAPPPVNHAPRTPVAKTTPAVVPAPVPAPAPERVPAPAAHASIRLEPAVLDFSARPSDKQQVHITNVGSAPLLISNMSVEGADASRFKISGQGCSVLAPGTDCNIAVQYHAKAWGKRKSSYVAELELQHNGENMATAHGITLRWQGKESGFPAQSVVPIIIGVVNSIEQANRSKQTQPPAKSAPPEQPKTAPAPPAIGPVGQGKQSTPASIPFAMHKSTVQSPTPTPTPYVLH